MRVGDCQAVQVECMVDRCRLPNRDRPVLGWHRLSEWRDASNKGFPQLAIGIGHGAYLDGLGTPWP